MFGQIVVNVDAQQACAGLWHGQRLRQVARFANDDEGYHAFAAYLRAQAGIPVVLVVDTEEEDFRLEAIPHATLWTRREMIERRLNQIYRDSPYRAASPLGREADKRRDHRLLLMSLTNPELVAPWVSALQEVQSILTGIYLLPQAGESLLRLLGLKGQELLLVTRQGSGLRQTFFSAGRLRVSRLTPLSALEQGETAQLYAREIEKTRLHLVSMRLITQDTRLQVVCPATARAEDGCRGTPNLQGVECTMIPLKHLQRLTRLSAETLQQYPELLHMHALVRGKPAGNLAPSAQMQAYALHRQGRGLYTAASVIMLAATAAAAANMGTANDLRRQLEVARSETAQLERLHAETLQRIPRTTLSGRDLRIGVELAEHLKMLNRTPETAMRVLGTALDANPDVRLSRMHWTLAGLDPSDSGGREDMSLTQAALAQHPRGAQEIMIVEGEIVDDGEMAGDAMEVPTRSADDAPPQLRRFIEALRGDKAVTQAELQDRAGSAHPPEDLQGNTLDVQTQQSPAAAFRLRIMLGPRNDA